MKKKKPEFVRLAVSLTLTPAEVESLKARAFGADMALAAYIRNALRESGALPPKVSQNA
jgi:hypothetical protein